MTTLYTNIADVINEKIEEIFNIYKNDSRLAPLRETLQPANDIAEAINNLADVMFEGFKLEYDDDLYIKEKYSNMALTDANAVAKLIDVLDLCLEKYEVG